MKKETLRKVIKCKALQGMTVQDVVNLERFRDNLAAYLTAQREDRKAIRASYEAMRKAGGAKGYKLPAHVIDKFMACSVEDFAKAFLDVLSRQSERPAREREYITQLGKQAYNLTVAQIVVEEFPETESELIPKTKGNGQN